MNNIEKQIEIKTKLVKKLNAEVKEIESSRDQLAARYYGGEKHVYSALLCAVDNLDVARDRAILAFLDLNAAKRKAMEQGIEIQ